MSIDNLINDLGTTKRFGPRTNGHAEALPTEGRVDLVNAASILPENVQWIWPDWLAHGKFHVLAGSVGTGKTNISLSLAAAITSGGRFPCGSCAEVGSALIWSGEDDLADSLLPRFLACGGDTRRFYSVGNYRGADGVPVPFDPAEHIDALCRAAAEIHDLRLIIVDPVVSVVDRDSHKNSETRRALQPLVDLAARLGAAVLGITHFSKSTSGRDPAERVTGSLAFTALPRLVMATAKPANEGDLARLVRVKSNIGPSGGGFEYALERVCVDQKRGISGQKVEWGAYLEGIGRELLAEVEAASEDSKAPLRTAAENWLRELLGTGAAPVPYIETMAKHAGHSWATVRRAKEVIGAISVQTTKNGKRVWVWRIPQVLTSLSDAHLKSDEQVSRCSDAHALKGERVGSDVSACFEDESSRVGDAVE